MSNPINPRPLTPVFDEMVRAGFDPKGAFFRLIRDLATRGDKVLTDNGAIQSVANVSGRTEALSATLQNVDTTGKLTSTDAIAADGTGSPLTGGKRGFIGFTSISGNIRISNSLTQVPVSLNGAFTGANPLTQSGVSTTINVAAWQMQFGGIGAGGNSGSVDPGSMGTWYVYIDMPVLTLIISGAIYSATANVFDLTANDGRICLGKITTAGGGGGTGAGTGGGGNTGVRTLL